MRQVVGTHDILFITLDTLRYDVAQAEFEAGRLPVLQRFLPPAGWERRHTPGSFTYAAHHAFFSGFLPTPVTPGRHPRLFASAFSGSETIVPHTCVFEQATFVEGLAQRGYRTVCIGGVGFFNLQTSLGRVLPGLFQEQHWSESMSVTSRRSTEAQVALARDRLQAIDGRVLLFLNVSAIHAPNRIFLPPGERAAADTLHSHAAALRYADAALAPLFDSLAARGPAFAIVCSDHGGACGEDGHHGHRVAHEAVWTVPYTHFFLGG
jgi:hypothetical protein